MSEKIIRTIAQYSIIRPIGSGGMATVYEAVDERLGRSAAIKILHPHLASDNSAVERFKREALSAAKLVHPNIVQVYDYIEQDGDRCIALEFVPGTDAESVVRRSGSLGFKNTLTMMHPVAQALKIAHHHDMIHRDVKPSNIMIRPDKRVMLTDFGLVKGSLDISLTMDNSIAGTPAFMAPEQISGKRLLPTTDIYAWAVSFYFILTGMLPYKSSEFLSLVDDIKSGKTNVDEEAMSAMPGKYASLIRRCLLPNPFDRPKDASELLGILGSIPDNITLDDSICNPEHIDREISAYATERSIAKTVVGKVDSGKKGRLFTTAITITAILLISFFILRKPKESSTNNSANLINIDTLLGKTENKYLQSLANTTRKTRPSDISKNKKKQEKTASAKILTNKTSDNTQVKPDSGALFIFSEPWANVEINGVLLGKTPLGTISFPSGSHAIRLYSEFTEEIRDSLKIIPGKTTRKRYQLIIKPAYRK